MTWLLAAWRWIAASRAGQAVGAVIAVLAGVLLYGRHNRSQGRTEAERDAQDDANERVQKGRDAVRDGRGDDPDDRLRRNDQNW